MSRYSKKVGTPLKEREVAKIQVQVAHEVFIGNRPPTTVFVRTDTDRRGHFHTAEGICLKYSR